VARVALDTETEEPFGHWIMIDESATLSLRVNP
jgi:hypothetical protein